MDLGTERITDGTPKVVQQQLRIGKTDEIITFARAMWSRLTTNVQRWRKLGKFLFSSKLSRLIRRKSMGKGDLRRLKTITYFLSALDRQKWESLQKN